MLVTEAKNQTNKKHASRIAMMIAVVFVGLGFFFPWAVLGVLLAPLVYWWWRHETIRRSRVMAKPLPAQWEAILRSKVAYFDALEETQQDRFRQMVKVFLDETRITGIQTEVDEATRILVAASAIIPVFNFQDWEYTRLGEVLIYPASFSQDYRREGEEPRSIMGMVGTGYLSGVMILSKHSLHTGFDIANDKQNVGIHEFAHLVDGADGDIDGIPPGVPAEVARSWIKWVGEELDHPPAKRSHIDRYAYTNEAEYFAVLVEYFFEAPEKLKQKNPELYGMLRTMFHQDTASFLPQSNRRRARRFGRNSPCPCDSGEKYKRCCLRTAVIGMPS